MTGPRLELRNIAMSFGPVHALRDVSFSIAPGEIHALVGENGAGKSTLVGIITGLQSPTVGEVLLDGEPVEFRTSRDARASGVAAVYQDPNLFPHLSVAENIFASGYPLRHGRIDRKAMREHASELLRRLGFEMDVNMPVAGLTVAEAQFVEIARAISGELKVLILDEPTSALTPSEAVKLYEVVRRLRDVGTSIVWISHRMEEIHMLADTITVLRDGQHVRTAPSQELSDSELIQLMVGRSVVLERKEREEPLGPVRLSVRGLTQPGVFENVDFDIHEGEIVGMAGLVGAGRTEIAQAVFGVHPRKSGEVRVDGRVVHPKGARSMSKLGVTYVPEDRDAEGIVSTMSVTRNISLPSTPALTRFGLVDSGRERALAERQRQELSIKAELDSVVSSLSGGNRQKVALARWLATEPGVLLLDEPTHGIDIGTKAQVHDIMRRLAREQRLAILMVSSDLQEVLAVSDRILIVARGRIVADLPADTATQESVMAAATRIAPTEAITEGAA